jgi:3-methyladenine DNA glycosylase AlkD
MHPAIAELQTRLDQQADPATQQWFERYMKGVLPFRGLKLPLVRTIVQAWYPTIAALPPTEIRELALALLDQPHGEDKLAGILILQEKLLPKHQLDYQTAFPQFIQAFTDGAIADWNTCDWFCVRVLHGMAVQQGEDCVRAIASWQAASNLWQRRASCVSCVKLAKQGDRVFTGFVDLLLEVGETVVQSTERFSQTAVGWLWRELWLAAPDAVVDRIEANITAFSSEGLRYATEKMPRDEQLRLRALRKISLP